MKVLLVGVGQLGLGLVVPVFTEAGYEVIGTDANIERLDDLRPGYLLGTPRGTSQLHIATVRMDDVKSDYDLMITSVGRTHLQDVADWYHAKQISAPVILAENLPDPVSIFPRQIPAVVDRICPKVEKRGDMLTAIAEDYYKFVVLDEPLTHRLGEVSGVEMEATEEAVELKRKQKMFTVNTSHLLIALYGQQLGCTLVEEAIAKPEIAAKIRLLVAEVAPVLGFNRQEAAARAEEIIRRFSNPIKDLLTRILVLEKKKSALRYIEVPLQELKVRGLEAPTLEEAYRLLSS